MEEFRNDGDGDSHRQKTSLFDLPNEKVLIHVLALFPTEPLLRLRSVSHRFQSLIIRIVHGRLLLAASLKDRKLIFECYHPSAQYTEPYLYCDYLGTPGLSDTVEGLGLVYDSADHNAREGTLRELYSRFRPTLKDQEPQHYRSHPAGSVPGSRTSDQASSSRQAAETECVKQNVSLEAHELFTQLRFTACLVQIGPRRGVFLSCEAVVEKKTTRIWRQWLTEKNESEGKPEEDQSKANANELNEDPAKRNGDHHKMLWVDQNKIVGLKVQVKERNWRRDAPVLLHRDEDQAVSYSLELEELLISTTHLLLAVEKTLLAKDQDSSKAMIFGSFATQETQQNDTVR